MGTLPGATAQSISSSCEKGYSMASFAASVDTAIMGRKTLDAGLKTSGGSLPRSHMAMYVFSKAKPLGE
jgi:hypothetical protein